MRLRIAHKRRSSATPPAPHADLRAEDEGLSPEVVLVTPELHPAAIAAAAESRAHALSPELVLVSPELRDVHVFDEPGSIEPPPADTPSVSAPRRRAARRAVSAWALRRAAVAHRAALAPLRSGIVRACVLTACFFAGAALSAGAGDQVANTLEATEATAPVTTTEEATDATAPVTTTEEATDATATVTATEEAPAETALATTTEPVGAPSSEETPSAEDGDADTPAADEEPPATVARPVAEPPEEPPAESEPIADGVVAEPPEELPGESEPIADGVPLPGGETDEPTETVEREGVVAPHAGQDPAKRAKKRRHSTRRPKPRGEPPATEERNEPVAPVRLAPEISLPTLMRGPLPDPTPPARRLDPSVARFVLRTAREASVEWELLLGVVRVTSADPRAAERTALVRRLARRLAAAMGERRRDAAVRAVAGPRAAAHALALARYHRAVGIETLVRGLRAARPVLTVRVLTDPRIAVYAAGRRDIEERRIDVRLLALLLYLAESHGDVTVSSLVSGHRTYARPGVVSAHVPGLAVDISALGGVPIAGNQGAGSVTERAVRDILLLPPELQPQQLISLIDLGGASFALSDHSDHIHVGYGPIPARDGWGRLRDLWHRAGRRYGVPWQVLAAINKIESDFGRNMGPSSAGAVGWMQFMPSTWARWGLDADRNGVASPWDPDDAVFSAARYLAAAGARTDLPRAIFAYNHADWYVRDVLETARRFGP